MNKKSGRIAMIVSLVIILLASVAGGCIFNLFSIHTYSETNCLTDKITDEMSVYDIAKLYRDSNATVEVQVSGYSKREAKSYTSLGSGVCVASNGYTTTSLPTNITASKGSYIVTNYHVISFYDDSNYSSVSSLVVTENEQKHSTKLIWLNKDLDVAILYTEDNFDYVKMIDRWIDCDKEVRLDYEQVFTIGTPLDPMYLNRLTVGNIASNNNNYMLTVDTYYPSINSYSSISGVTVLSNVYEDVIDVSLGITNGNSGGGCFDANGYLIGLTTLGSSVSQTAGNQMNGVVAIYPVIKVLDKLIANNEQNCSYSVQTLESNNIKGVDEIEASYLISIQEETNYSYYYIDGSTYSTTLYSSVMQEASETKGYSVLSSSSTKLSTLKQGDVITKVSIGEKTFAIEDRNDLIYALLNINDGDSVVYSYYDSTSLISLTKTVTVQY